MDNIDDLFNKLTQEAVEKGKDPTDLVTFVGDDPAGWRVTYGAWEVVVDADTGNITISLDESSRQSMGIEYLARAVQRLMEETRNVTLTTVLGLLSGQISEALQQAGLTDERN